MPQRIQMSRSHPWRAEHPDAVIVDRRTKWGNPYRVHEHSDRCGEDLENCDIIYGVSSAEIAVDQFRYAYCYPVIGQPRMPNEDEIRAELAGRDLACWCPLDQPCHADVLLALANPAPAPAGVSAATSRDRPIGPAGAPIYSEDRCDNGHVLDCCGNCKCEGTQHD